MKYDIQQCGMWRILGQGIIPVNVLTEFFLLIIKMRLDVTQQIVKDCSVPSMY